MNCKIISSVRDTKQRQILTKYRLSEHRLAIETADTDRAGYPESKECVHTARQERSRQVHFLLQCHEYISISNLYFNKLTNLKNNFTANSETEQIKILLGEGQTAALAARYVCMCHSLRNSRWMCVCVRACVRACVSQPERQRVNVYCVWPDLHVCYPIVHHSDP